MIIGERVQLKDNWELPNEFIYLTNLVESFGDKQLIIHSIDDVTSTCQLEDQSFIGDSTNRAYYYNFPLCLFKSTTPKTQSFIVEECDKIRDELLRKNRKYGDSAVNPVRIFSKADNLEQIRVRLDDKINRLINQQGDEDEDVLFDLIGYLVLYRVAKRIQEES